jgi:hypothetical protein
MLFSVRKTSKGKIRYECHIKQHVFLFGKDLYPLVLCFSVGAVVTEVLVIASYNYWP